MRFKTLAAIVSFVLLGLNDGACAQQTLRPADTTVAWNDNSLIAIQKKGGDPTRPGDVRIEFYGHDAFKVTSPVGLTILTDPWRNDATGRYPKWFLREFPTIRVDIVLSTHAHFDHDAVERPKGLMILERFVGHYSLGDIEIIGLADKHKCETASADKPDDTCPPNNVLGLDNAIQLIETGGLRIALWGDNRPAPDPFLDHYLNNVDVLILPVESVLTRVEVDAIVGKYNPKAVIPAHYFLAGLTTEVSGVESVDAWVNDEEKVRHADVRRLDHAEFTLNAAELKGAHHRIYYFGNHIEGK